MNLQIGETTFVTRHVYATTIVLMEANCIFSLELLSYILVLFNTFQVLHLSLMCYVIDR